MMEWIDVEMELSSCGRSDLGQSVREAVQQMHGLLLWALWHNQGASSPVGLPIRRALGIDAHAPLTTVQLTHAKQTAESLPFNAKLKGGST